MSRYDAYVNIAGGMKMNEPALDLAVVMALVSSFKNREVDPGMLIFGEVGLSGEVRAVSQAGQRVAEAVKWALRPVCFPGPTWRSSGVKTDPAHWSGECTGGHRGGIFFFPGFPYG